MEEEKATVEQVAQSARREFLKKAGTVAATAPAAALLLSASAVPNKAIAAYDDGND